MLTQKSRAHDVMQCDCFKSRVVRDNIVPRVRENKSYPQITTMVSRYETAGLLSYVIRPHCSLGRFGAAVMAKKYEPMFLTRPLKMRLSPRY